MRVARIDARFDPTIYIALVWRTCWRLAAVVGWWCRAVNAGPAHQFYDVFRSDDLANVALAWMFNIVERGSAAYSRIARCWRKRRW